jgi:two-component system chemotaxis response regulator CheB
VSINVLVADDSAYLRKSIADILKGHELINIIEFAKNGEEAVDFVGKYSPDVLVLDLVMPKMNGLEAFKLIMDEHPTPTVILSAISPKNLDSSIQALLMGAFDYIIKPGGIGAKDLPRFKEELLAKVLLASQSQIKKIFRKEDQPFKKGKTIRQEIIDEIFGFGQYLNRLQPVQETEKDQKTQIIDIGKTKVVPAKETQQFVKKETSGKVLKKGEVIKSENLSRTEQKAKRLTSSSLLKTPISTTYLKKEPTFVPNLTPVRGVILTSNIVVIGASVGGPRTITTILKELPRGLGAPILIVQHLSAHFTQAFVDNLSIECNMRVRIATNGEILQAGVCYIAPGDKHMEIGVENKKPIIKLYKGTPVNFCMPSIDVLFFSAARICRNRTLGIILTGMGSDGVEGLGAIQKLGGKTIAESEKTSILYAMPRIAAEKGFADLKLPNFKIAEKIVDFTKK